MRAYIRFGRFPQCESDREPIRWLILNQMNDKMLLMSEKCLAVETYHFKPCRIAWQNSNLRAWLHEIFLNRAFRESEAHRIIHSEPSPAGKHCTDDCIFLLSCEEVLRYLPEQDERIALASPAADKILRMRGYRHDDMTCSWWLRHDRVSDSIRQDVINRNGLLGRHRCDDLGTLVRPALWLRT